MSALADMTAEQQATAVMNSCKISRLKFIIIELKVSLKCFNKEDKVFLY